MAIENEVNMRSKLSSGEILTAILHAQPFSVITPKQLTTHSQLERSQVQSTEFI